jgi:hypothetical protein
MLVQKVMARFRRRKGEFHDLEHDLRSARPEPGDHLVRRISAMAATDRSRSRFSPMRLGLAAAMTLLVFGVFAGLGGLNRTASAAEGVVNYVQSGHIFGDFSERQSPAVSTTQIKVGPSNDQYVEKITICHREQQGQTGQTLTLPPSGANNHLNNHQYDTEGPCEAS